MLSCNLWVKAVLVNGALRVIVQIVYTPGFSTPKLPSYVVMEFDNYIGPPWDQCQLKHIPISPIQRSNRKKIPLEMDWALNIHKSQGLTLTRSTIDIGNTKHQGFTFTEMPQMTTLQGM